MAGHPRRGGRRLCLDNAGPLEVRPGDLEWAKVNGKDKHHLDAANLNDLATTQGPGLTSFPQSAIHLQRVATLDEQPPCLLVAVEIDDGVETRDELAGAQVDVHRIRVFLGLIGPRLCGFRQAANVDREPRNVVCPINSSDLRVSLDPFLIGLVDAVGMIFAGLWWYSGSYQMLDYSSYKLVVIIDDRLIGNMRRVALINRLGGLGRFGGVVILFKEALLVT